MGNLGSVAGAGHRRLQRGRGWGLPRATAKRLITPPGSVTPDKEERVGGTEGRAGGREGGGKDWVRRREAGAQGRGEAPALLWRSRLISPRAGTVLDVTASRFGARLPSRASPHYRRHISPPTPAPLPLGLVPAPPSHPGRLGPLRTSHTAHRRQPPSSRARALAPPPTGAHVTARPRPGLSVT